MDAQLALRVLGQVMKWNDEEAGREFRWLQLMGKIKYDGYEDYRAGVRFLESLAHWLQQFDFPDRQDAYSFARGRMLYFSPAELQRLIELFYPRTLEPMLVERVGRERGIPAFQVWINTEARMALEQLKRKTLIMALSDGARIDQLRRATGHVLGNEQFVAMTEVNIRKWKSALDRLKKDLKNENARFEIVCLLDDFAGTGSTVLRFETDDGWTGRLTRFLAALPDGTQGLAIEDVVEPGWMVLVHHYLGAPGIKDAMAARATAAKEEGAWFRNLKFSFGLELPASVKIEASRDAAFCKLAARHYNSSIQDEHTVKGGVERLDFGYGGCALPLVLDHNTPNNSVALLWAECEAREKEGLKEPEMRALFRRRVRHS